MVNTIIMILGVVLGFVVMRMADKAIPTVEEDFLKNHGMTLEEYKKTLDK